MQPESLLGYLVIGLIAGALGKLLMPGKDPGGCFITMIIGIIGSFIGGFIASTMGMGEGGTIMKIIMATVGAVIFLLVYRLVVGKKPSSD